MIIKTFEINGGKDTFVLFLMLCSLTLKSFLLNLDCQSILGAVLWEKQAWYYWDQLQLCQMVWSPDNSFSSSLQIPEIYGDFYSTVQFTKLTVVRKVSFKNFIAASTSPSGPVNLNLIWFTLSFFLTRESLSSDGALPWFCSQRYLSCSERERYWLLKSKQCPASPWKHCSTQSSGLCRRLPRAPARLVAGVLTDWIHLIVLRHGNEEDDSGDIVEVVDPLLPLVPLPGHVD